MARALPGGGGLRVQWPRRPSPARACSISPRLCIIRRRASRGLKPPHSPPCPAHPVAGHKKVLRRAAALLAVGGFRRWASSLAPPALRAFAAPPSCASARPAAPLRVARPLRARRPRPRGSAALPPLLRPAWLRAARSRPVRAAAALCLPSVGAARGGSRLPLRAAGFALAARPPAAAPPPFGRLFAASAAACAVAQKVNKTRSIYAARRSSHRAYHFHPFPTALETVQPLAAVGIAERAAKPPNSCIPPLPASLLTPIARRCKILPKEVVP